MLVMNQAVSRAAKSANVLLEAIFRDFFIAHLFRQPIA
jgi:hypothetical protein